MAEEGPASEPMQAKGQETVAEPSSQPSETALGNPDAAATEATPVISPPEAAANDGVAGTQNHDVGDSKNGGGEGEDGGKGGDQAGGEGGVEEKQGMSSERGDISEHAPPLVVTDIALVTFREGENVRAVNLVFQSGLSWHLPIVARCAHARCSLALSMLLS